MGTTDLRRLIKATSRVKRRGLAVAGAAFLVAGVAIALRPVASAPPGAGRPIPPQVTPAKVQTVAPQEHRTPAKAQVTTAPFTLTASIERAVPEGQPALLVLELHNNGKERLMIGGSAFEQSSFRIAVTDGTGRAVPRTAVGERVLTPPTAVSANGTVIIDPGQTLEYRFNLARLFDLSQAGNYAVSVSRTVAPWPYFISRPKMVTPTPPKVTNLTVGPLKFRMVEDAAAVSGPTALTPLPGHQTLLFMASQYDSGISRWRVAEDGRISFAFDPSVPSAKQVGKGADSIAATPDGRFLYVCNGDDETVSQFRTGADGALTSVSPPSVPTAKHPHFLLMDPKGRFLYALSNWGNTIYTIAPDGRLTAVAQSSTDVWAKDRDHNIVPTDFAVIDPAGNFLYTCNGVTFGYRLAPNGTVTALPTPVSGAAGPNRGRDNLVVLSPSGKFAFVGVSTNNSSAGFDLVVPMRVGADGTLTPLPGAQTPQAPPLPSPGFQPFFCTTLSVDPTGHFLIVVNPGYLDCYRIRPDGSLTALGMTTQQGNLDSVFFVPGSHLFYALNRNPPSLLAFRLDDRRGLIPADVDMPNGIPFAASIAAAVAPVSEHWGPAGGGLAVSVRLPDDVLPTDAPVVLTLTLKNVTNRPVRLGTTGADMTSFHLSLTGPQRQSPGVLRGGGEPVAGAVPLLAAGHDLLDAPGTGGAALVLPAGEERQYKFVLSRLADLTLAGNYTVQVTRTLPDGAASASPVVPFLLDGPFNGVVRGGRGQGVSVL